MILKEIGRKIAQAFRLAQAADKKLSTGIAAALDAKAEQLRGMTYHTNTTGRRPK